MQPCKNGKHTLKEITRFSLHYMGDEVTMWCKFCGGVVVYLEVDGRIMQTVHKMEFPQICYTGCIGSEER